MGLLKFETVICDHFPEEVRPPQTVLDSALPAVFDVGAWAQDLRYEYPQQVPSKEFLLALFLSRRDDCFLANFSTHSFDALADVSSMKLPNVHKVPRVLEFRFVFNGLRKICSNL